MAMGQKESARVSLAATVERVCVLFALMIFIESPCSLRSWWVIGRLLHHSHSTQAAEQKAWEKGVAEVTWWLCGSRNGIGVGVDLYLRSFTCHPHSCPPPLAENVAAWNLKGLIINSFSLQLLNEPLRRNESSLPAPCPPTNRLRQVGSVAAKSSGTHCSLSKGSGLGGQWH